MHSQRGREGVTSLQFKGVGGVSTQLAVCLINGISLLALPESSAKFLSYSNSFHDNSNDLKRNCLERSIIVICFFTPELSCTDSDEKKCSNWAKKDECTKNPGWMLKNCCKSCKKGKIYVYVKNNVLRLVRWYKSIMKEVGS